jgi:hypothetical protein
MVGSYIYIEAVFSAGNESQCEFCGPKDKIYFNIYTPLAVMGRYLCYLESFLEILGHPSLFFKDPDKLWL